jgi:hypothetical protein
MPDTTPVTTAITRLITAGTTEQALLALSPAELSQALQVGQAEAERKALRPH